MNRKEALNLVRRLSAVLSSQEVVVPPEYAKDQMDSEDYIKGYTNGEAAILTVGWSIPLNEEESENTESYYDDSIPLTKCTKAFACGYLDGIKKSIEKWSNK